MNNSQLDVEYHNMHDAYGTDARALGFGPEPCGRWSKELDLNCERPPVHDGDHAAVLGMDPDTNDWVRWAK